jgi:hypothetical protein
MPSLLRTSKVSAYNPDPVCLVILQRLPSVDLKLYFVIYVRIYVSYSRILHWFVEKGGLILDCIYIFNKSTPEICYKPFKSTENR